MVVGLASWWFLFPWDPNIHKKSRTKWFNSWPFYHFLSPIVGGHLIHPVSSDHMKISHPKKVTFTADLPGAQKTNPSRNQTILFDGFEI